MKTTPRVTPIALCYNRNNDLFRARFISTDPEIVRLVPNLSSHSGVLVFPLTAFQLRENFGVEAELVQIAQASPV